jgi:hypothetical protein
MVSAELSNTTSLEGTDALLQVSTLSRRSESAGEASFRRVSGFRAGCLDTLPVQLITTVTVDFTLEQ